MVWKCLKTVTHAQSFSVDWHAGFVVNTVIICIFVIQASTSHHTREAPEVHRLLTRLLIQIVGPASVVEVVVVDKASQCAAYCVFYKTLASWCE